MMVLAPSSGEMAPMRLGHLQHRAHHAAGIVAEAGGDKAGMQALAVTPLPSMRRASSRLNRMLQSLDLA